MKTMLCVPGFGDDSTMFAPLIASKLSLEVEIVPLNLPGFGAPRPNGVPATLNLLAKVIDEKAKAIGSQIVLAHSVASISASLAAQRPGSTITTVLSLEGNLTAEDAYFSGTAAGYDTPMAFHRAFIRRLHKLAKDNPAIDRYRSRVECADPIALWELGRDAHRYSQNVTPGDVLARADFPVYLYNPENVPRASQRWLQRSSIPRIKLAGASHWKSADQPSLLATKLIKALALSK
ncbi:MAG: alpha/beta hydrolase [Erythrobacter sp.]